MKKKKLLYILIAAVLALAVVITTIAIVVTKIREADTRKAAVVMDKAVNELETVSNVILAASETEEEETQQAAASSVKTMSGETDEAKFYFTSPREAIVRQMYVNYPYNIVNYMMQSAVNGNYDDDFTTGRVFYGTATKTISDDINKVFEDKSLTPPTLAVEVTKEEYGVSFIADWDWRNDVLKKNAPVYNSVIMTNAKVECDDNGEIKKIMMTWYWTEKNGDFIASTLDVEKDEFFFMEGATLMKTDKPVPEKSLPDAFNDGDLTYEKLCEYPYQTLRVIKSNVTNDVNELELSSIERRIGGGTIYIGAEEEKFIELYNEIYGKVRGLKMRAEKDEMSLIFGKKVSFMNDAATYGLKRGEYVANDKGVKFLFLEEWELESVLNDLKQNETIKNNAALKDLIHGARGALHRVKGRYVGKLGKFKGKKYSFEYSFSGEHQADTWRHHCKNFLYVITDGVSSVSFDVENGKPVNVFADTSKGVRLELSDDGEYYTAYGKSDGTKDIIIPATYRGLPVKKIADNAFYQTEIESVAIPASVEQIGYNAFWDCASLERVYYTGTVDDWLSFRVSELDGELFNREYDFYLNGELLTDVTVTSGLAMYRFKLCRSIEKITFAENATNFRTGVFNECPNLKEIYYNAVNGVYDEENGGSADGMFMFSGANTDGITVYIGEKVKKIPKFIFRVSPVKEIKFAENGELTAIGEDAFSECKNLTSVTIGENVTQLDGRAFFGCSNLDTIYFNARAMEESVYGGTHFYGIGSENGFSVFVGASVETLPSTLFSQCSNLKRVIFDENSAITEFGERLFSGCSMLTSITFPKKLSKIGNFAFGYCSGLVGVTIPETVTDIGECAFSGCSGLTSVNLPDTITEIAAGTFSGCSSLESINFPTALTKIGEYAFSNCSSLTEMVIPSSVTSVCEYAFFGCSGLTRIVVPETVTDVGNDLFADCYSIETATVPTKVFITGDFTSLQNFPKQNLKTVTIYGEELPNAVFNCASALTSVTLLDGIKRIGDYAFWGCIELTEVRIPDSVTYLGENAFEGCQKLTGTQYNGATYLGDENNPYHVLYGLANVVDTFTLHSATKIIYGFNRDYYQGEYNFHNGVAYVGTAENPYAVMVAFYGNDETPRNFAIETHTQTEFIAPQALAHSKWLYKVVIGENVRYIAQNAFEGCNKLLEIYNKSPLTLDDSFAENIYTDDSGESKILLENDFVLYKDGGETICVGYNGPQTDITVPDGVTAIGKAAFYDCGELTSITLPESLTLVDNESFYWCDGLTDVYFTGDLAAWCGVEFKSFPLNFGANLHINGEPVGDLTIPDSVTKISDSAFYGCKNLTSVTVCGATIGRSAFQGCENLTSAVLSNSVTEVGVSAFAECKNLTSVTLGDGVTEIPTSAFNGCEKLSSVAFLGSVTKIGEYAFQDCVALTSLVLPESLQIIGSQAFVCCAFTEVVIPDSVTEIGDFVFAGCASLKTVTFGTGVKKIGRYAFNMSSVQTVVFKNANGWYVSTDRYATGGTNVDVSDSATATALIKGQYLSYYWYRKES